jgi:hypothetical protein
MSFTSGPYATQAQIVLRTDQEFQRKNTSLAYYPKMKEFKEFCHYEYTNSEHPTIVTEERTFAFLF